MGKSVAGKRKKSPKKAAAKARLPKTPDPYAVGPRGLFQLVDEKGKAVAQVPDLPEGLAVRLLEAMLFQRALDQRMLNLQRQGRIGFYGTAKGQEGAVLGSGAAFEPQDWLFPALREGAAALWRGMALESYIAQCFGNAADATLGRQMPCHYSDADSRYVSLSSPIGTQITHAVGAARGIQIKGEKDVIVGGYLGDGATSSNDFHAGMNFAGVWKAPIVYVCQNNQWAISVPAAAQTASETFALKANAYGMPGLRVDGNDVLACYVATRMAADRARRGEGPTFIECLTFRLGGHSSSDDPSKYRDENVAKAWEQRDPLLRHRQWLVDRGEWSDERQEAFLDEAGRTITEAIATVEAADPPATETLFTGVWAEMPLLLKEQRDRCLGDEPA